MPIDEKSTRPKTGNRDKTQPNQLKIHWDAATESKDPGTPSEPGPIPEATVHPSQNRTDTREDVHTPDAEPAQEVQDAPSGAEKLRPSSRNHTHQRLAKPSVQPALLVQDMQRMIQKLSTITQALQDLDRLIHESLDIIEPVAPQSSGPPSHEAAEFLTADNRKELLELIARRINGQ